MNNEELIRINLDNAAAVDRGIYSGLLCPKCRRKSVEVFFSEQNLKKGYGIWFECITCGNVEHISCGREPDGFTPLRVSEKFQKLDEQAWEEEE
jgi:hypothetical protein